MVIAISVVVQAGFLVPVLALEPNRIRYSGLASRVADDLFGLPPGLVLSGPGDIAFVVGQFLRRAQVVYLVARNFLFAEPWPGRSQVGPSAWPFQSGSRLMSYRPLAPISFLALTLAVSAIGPCRVACASGTKLPASWT
jgi:hypothetical protein